MSAWPFIFTVSFSVAGLMAWNSFPNDLWDLTRSTACFCSLMKTTLFTTCVLSAIEGAYSRLQIVHTYDTMAVVWCASQLWYNLFTECVANRKIIVRTIWSLGRRIRNPHYCSCFDFCLQQGTNGCIWEDIGLQARWTLVGINFVLDYEVSHDFLVLLERLLLHIFAEWYSITASSNTVPSRWTSKQDCSLAKCHARSRCCVTADQSIPVDQRRMCAWTRSVAWELIPILRPLSRRG